MYNTERFEKASKNTQWLRKKLPTDDRTLSASEKEALEKEAYNAIFNPKLFPIMAVDRSTSEKTTITGRQSIMEPEPEIIAEISESESDSSPHEIPLQFNKLAKASSPSY